MQALHRSNLGEFRVPAFNLGLTDQFWYQELDLCRNLGHIAFQLHLPITLFES